MSIMDHFKAGSVTPAPATSQIATPPAAPADTPVTPTAPLDTYKEMWNNDPNYKAPGSDPIFAPPDPAKLMEAAKTLDFTSMIPSEVMVRIAAGGQDGQDAFQEALRTQGSHIYAQNAHATTEIVKRALDSQEKNLLAKLPGYLKNQGVTAALSELNPALSHPAMKPVVETVQRQLQVKFPNATEKELTQQVSNYFDAMAKIAGGSQAVGVNAANMGTDWEKFLAS